jgi:hypothetical protein
MVYRPEDEEEDSLFPAQFATRPAYLNGEWSPEEYSMAQRNTDEQFSYFLPVPKPKRWSWSWSFVFHGRRRRMTLHTPNLSWSTFNDFVGLLEGTGADAALHRRGLFKSTMLDIFSVSWVACAIWLVLAWWTF